MSDEMKPILRWEEPPGHGNSRGGSGSVWELIAEALRARPGEWAVIQETNPGTAGAMVNRVKTGWGPFKPARSFQAVCRKVDDRTAVYAHYVGDGS
jgi:hypothetical protein